MKTVKIALGALMALFAVVISCMTGCGNPDLSSALTTEIPYDLKNGYIVNGYVLVVDRDSGNFGIMGLDGRLVGDRLYKVVTNFSEGLAFVVDLDGKGGYINEDGKTVISSFEGKSIKYGDPFAGGAAKIMLDEVSETTGQPLTLYINPDGTEAAGVNVLTPDGCAIVDRGNEYSALYVSGDELFGLYDYEGGAKVTGPDYTLVTNFAEGFAAVVGTDGAAKIIDAGGSAVKNLSEAFPDIEVEYLNDYSSDGYAVNLKNKGAVILGENFDIRTETNFERIYSFSGGYAKFLKNGKYGVIDVHGKEVLAANYDAVSNVYDGCAVITKGDRHYTARFK